MKSHRSRKSSKFSLPSSPPDVSPVAEDWTLQVGSEYEPELPGIAENCSVNDESENEHYHTSDEEEGEIDQKAKKVKTRVAGTGFTANQWDVIVSTKQSWQVCSTTNRLRSAMHSTEEWFTPARILRRVSIVLYL
jgi:hypothetical protein